MNVTEICDSTWLCHIGPCITVLGPRRLLQVFVRLDSGLPFGVRNRPLCAKLHPLCPSHPRTNHSMPLAALLLVSHIVLAGRKMRWDPGWSVTVVGDEQLSLVIKNTDRRTINSPVFHTYG